jgi:hypothetical protein
VSDTVYTTSGPPSPGTDAPTLAEMLTAGQAMLAAAQASANAAAASAASALAAQEAAWNAPAITTILGAPVTSVFTRIGNIVPVAGDYTFSLIGGTLQPSQLPALTGAITSSAGSNVTSIGALPNDTLCSGDLLLTNMSQPATPGSGQIRLFALDASNKSISAINDAGVVSVMPQVQSLASGQFVTGIGANGAFTSAAPAAGNFSSLTGTASMAQMPADELSAAIEFVITGGGSPIQVGLQGWIQIPFPCTINSVTLLADQSGSITVDIWKTTYANYSPGVHPVASDSICASDVPNINSATKSTDSTLSGWTTSIAANSILAFNVKVAAVNITICTVILAVTKT